MSNPKTLGIFIKHFTVLHISPPTFLLLSSGTLRFPGTFKVQQRFAEHLAPNTDKRASLTAALQTKALQSICGVCVCVQLNSAFSHHSHR